MSQVCQASELSLFCSRPLDAKDSYAPWVGVAALRRRQCALREHANIVSAVNNPHPLTFLGQSDLEYEIHRNLNRDSFLVPNPDENQRLIHATNLTRTESKFYKSAQYTGEGKAASIVVSTDEVILDEIRKLLRNRIGTRLRVSINV